MFGRLSIVLAIACYVLIVGCVMTPAPRPVESGRSPARTFSATGRTSIGEGMPYRGVAMQLQRVDWMARYKQSLDEIAALGADTVSVVVDARQEHGSSTRIYIDQRVTPSAEQLIDLIKHAKSKKLRVMLMPIVLLDAPRTDREWRGTLAPDSWEDWFDNYRALMGHYTWIAQTSGVDILVVGSELVSSESKGDQWKRTIAEIRRGFKGKLTYSSNWDHYKDIPFWDQLDFVGMNSYWSFARGEWKPGREKEVTVEQIKARWGEIQAEVLKFADSKNKPLLFTEVGWCSMANMAHEPWDYTKLSAWIDLDLQKRLYDGFFQSWHGNQQLGGFMVWEWPPGDGGPADRGYTPEGKPAEKVIREWFAKPWKQ